MIKKRNYLIIFLLLCSICVAQAKSKDVLVMEAMVQRLFPQHSGHFVFTKTASPDGKDFFSLDMKNQSVAISGNSANAMAMGLNYYLKRYCLTTVSWYADVPVELPEALPAVTKPFKTQAKVDRRFFLNYCTYGYTMPYWQWRDWERFIDWMALNGVNMPLAITGQESVWYNVWKKLGLTDEEIRSYFTGPTYLPWHRMANIDGWNGPLPKHWLESQTVLQKQILNRERELNMKPVLPAFAGHVPAALKRIFPNANIQYLGKWAGFANEYRCHFLNPEEPLFAEIQKQYLEEQKRLFGTDHIYGIDPFNEVDPPCWEPEYLSKVSNDIYRTLTAADPKAEWMQMTWMFYHDRKDWTAPRIKALLTGVPQGKMVLLDYHCENVELWKKTENFHGQPYIWCYLGNFGGNTTLTGNVKESGRRLDNALKYGGKNLWGIGSTLEGLDVMQFPYEYIFEKAWNINTDSKDWLNQLADRHVGTLSEEARKAWHLLYNDVFVQVPRTLGTLPCMNPVARYIKKRIGIDYKQSTLAKAWKLLLQVPSCERDAYEIDVISVGRQLLGNYFSYLKEDFDNMYKVKDLNAMKTRAAEMEEVLCDIDALNALHPRFTLEKWVNDAREYGNTPALKDYYELNAKNLITTWGGSLNDYASRSWSGLTRDYYEKRWKMYWNTLIQAVEQGHKYDKSKLEKDLKDFEDKWVITPYVGSEFKKGNVLEYSRFLLKKYEKRFLQMDANKKEI